MDDVEKSIALDMLNAGYSYCAVGKKLGRHDSTIARHFPKRGWPQGNPGMRPDELRRAEKMLDDGMSYNEVARTLGRHPTTISARFPGRGWPASRGAEMRKLNAELKMVKL